MNIVRLLKEAIREGNNGGYNSMKNTVENGPENLLFFTPDL